MDDILASLTRMSALCSLTNAQSIIPEEKPAQPHPEPEPHSEPEPEPEPAQPGVPRLSGHAQRRLARSRYIYLKRLAPCPGKIVPDDVRAPAPLYYAHLCAIPGTVAPPEHWCQKRRFLARRTASSEPLALPPTVSALGVEAALTPASDASVASAQRAVVTGSDLRRMVISSATVFSAYHGPQALRWSPGISPQGHVLTEARAANGAPDFVMPLPPPVPPRPGRFSAELLRALGMPSASAPPPWLRAMQAHGPPPAYPLLPLPGVTAPLPAGAVWGPKSDQWGEPPRDAGGVPLIAPAVPAQAWLTAAAGERRWGQV